MSEDVKVELEYFRISSGMCDKRIYVGWKETHEVGWVFINEEMCGVAALFYIDFIYKWLKK